ncbi:MAG: BlaI/MecI/CopY family transcriptional regulator [Ruminococcaceae bacterium]|nr:BlaI/MecI/CopY family transcriptional regulator [Oscillospiraceae bacterium]
MDNVITNGASDVKTASPDYTKKLPDTEFEVMFAIWNTEPPVNTAYLMDKVGKNHGWKAPTLISFLVRLEERGYITSEKKGKERLYSPTSDKAEYIRLTSEDFVNRYHNGSFVSMLEALYKDKKLTEEDIDQLLRWLKTKY